MTPNEKKATAALEAKRDDTLSAMAAAREAYVQAAREYARTRKAHRRALEELVKFRDSHTS